MQPSAFDEALYHPFIEERPQRKKWSINVLSSNKSSNADSISSLFRGDADMEDVDLEFGHLLDQQRGHQIESSMVDVETIVFEQALIGERHNDIINISHSMKSIHTISEDLAEIVNGQDSDIKRMSWFAIEAFEKTESGLERIIRAAKFSDQYQQAQRRKTGLFLLVGAMVVLGFSRALMKDGSGGGPVESQRSGSIDAQKYPDNKYLPVFHFPAIHLP
ncbi:hypothetical protein MHU86_13488 [Fragilaria crotonensis]|nr:hypothetical protein MHU86_13488 [Fragilaria crotonensis]